MVYDLTYDDHHRLSALLHFTGLERPVALRAGAPPYPKASHFDQTGTVTGHLVLDGERIDVDCFAMRDRFLGGTRKERGYQPVGYTWLANRDLSVLMYSHPWRGGNDEIYTGYVRRGRDIVYIASGQRSVQRDPDNGWITSIEVMLHDETGHEIRAAGTVMSRMILPGSTFICINSLVSWQVDGVEIHGEDQDVWPLHQWTLSGRINQQRTHGASPSMLG